MKKTSPYILLSVLVYLCLCPGIYGQVMIHSTWNPSSVLTMGDLLNISVENTLPSPMNTMMQISIETQKKEAVVTGTSKAILLNPGPTLFSNELNSQFVFSYAGTTSGKGLLSNQVFDAGEYRIYYKLISVNDQTVLGEYSGDFSVTSRAPLDELKDKKKSPVAFHGTSELLFNYSTAQTNFTALPPTYLNWTLNPQLTLFDVPVSGRLFLTTMQADGQQNMNSFTFNFDAEQFKNILKNKLLDFVKKNKTLNKIGNLDFDSYLKEYDNIKGILNNPAVADEIQKLGELDSLKNIYENIKDKGGDVKDLYDKGKGSYDELKDSYTNVKGSITGDSSQVRDTNTTHTTDSLKNNIENTFTDTKDSLNSIKDSLMALKDKGMSKVDSVKNKVEDVSGKVNTYINDPSALGTVAMDSLKGRIKELEWLESKKEYYDKLIEKKNKIEDLGKKYGLIDSAGNFTSFDKIKDIDAAKLSDPAYLYDKLKSSKLLRKVDKILYSVKSLSIGMSTPSYSTFSLNSMAVNGFSIEVEPFKVYGSFTYGTVLNPVLTLNTQNASYKRDLMAGKFGYGSKDKTHIHITVLSATDDSLSINPRDSIYLYYKRPQDNKVINVDGQLNLFKNKLIMSAEFSGSQTIKDLTVYNANNNILNPPTGADPSNWFVNILTQRQDVNKAVVDYAVTGKVEASLFKDKTKISATFKRIGPNYYSFGLPFLIRDMMTFEIKASQSFWKNRIQLMGFVRRNNDNLENTKNQTTQFYNYGIDISIRIPKWPTFKASITPLTLQSDTSYFNVLAFNINSSYNFKIRKTQNITSLSFIKQTSAANDTNYYFDISYINFLHSITVKKGPTINLNGSYVNSISSQGRKDTWIVGLGGSMTLFKIWSNLLGGNCYINQNETKWGAYYQTNINLLKYFTLSVRLENNQFNTYLNLPGITNYTQFICRTSIIARW